MKSKSYTREVYLDGTYVLSTYQINNKSWKLIFSLLLQSCQAQNISPSDKRIVYLYYAGRDEMKINHITCSHQHEKYGIIKIEFFKPRRNKQYTFLYKIRINDLLQLEQILIRENEIS